jgi:hypothetical protein
MTGEELFSAYMANAEKSATIKFNLPAAQTAQP